MTSAAPPSIYFESIDFNLSFYTEGDSSVSLNYVNNNFLKCVGYAYSRAISTSFNGILYALGGIDTTNINASGLITSTTGFKGSGAQLTNLNASNISAGTLAVARGGTGSSTLALGQLLIGNDTNPITQSANLIWDINNNNLGIGKNPAQKLDVNGTIAANLFSGSGASLTGLTEVQIPVLTAAKIPFLPQSRITGLEDFVSTTTTVVNQIALGTGISNLDAAKLTGTIANARLPTDISVNSFTGNGASITNVNASNIATGTINQDRITLTTQKIYGNFNTTNFAVIDDKIDLPPNYSFNITGYDSHTLHSGSVERKYKGRISANYDDRDGVYKLITTETSLTNKPILKYKAGDKITIRNTANPATDYLLYDNFKYFNSLVLIKRPNNRPLEWAVADPYSVFMYAWSSGDGDGFTSPAAKIIQTYEKTYPFTTPISFIVEEGFNYYLYKFYNTVDYDGGGTLFINSSPFGDDTNGFNSAFGAGQTFKLQSGSGFTPYDFMPKTYTPPALNIASPQLLGGVKPRRGIAIDATTGEIDAVPVSSDLINSMNTNHFVNNVATGKIDISTNLAELKGPKGDTGKGWTGATYSATTGKVSFTSGDGTPFVFDTGDLRGGKGDKGDKGDDGDNGTNGKGWTGATYSATTGKVSFTSTDGTPYVFDTGDLRGGIGATGKGWTDASYNATSGILTFNSGDGLGFTTGNLKGTNGTNGTNGKGWTGATYNATTGKVSFASTDGTPFVFDTGDLRGGAGANGKGWTGGSYNATTGIVSFTSNDAGYAFTTGDLRGASGATITTTQLSGLMNLTTDFSLNTVTNKIDLTTTKVWNAAQIPTLATTKITGLDTALAATQPKIISTAGQIIIGNGDGLTTTSTGLTWATNTLTATNLTTTTTLTTANLEVSTQGTFTRLLTAGLDADMFILQNNATNSLRFNQVFQALNDQKWILKQKSNNIDYNLFNFRNGKICVGTSANPAYMLDVVGDVNVTGDFKVNGNQFKPATAVLADTATVATKLATARTIAGTSFDGTTNINIDYFALNNKPIILQPTTTNLQLTSGYTFAVPGNVCIGSTAIATNVLQVGAGGRLRISNGTTDYTMIGTIDAEADTNTKIVISGNTRTGNLGNIQYYSTASGGNHIFYTSITPTTRMTISASGVNVNNDLGVSGNVGIGTAPSATYKVNVNGSLNATSVLVGGSAITGSKWTTSGTNIYYNSGNVGIGATTTSDVDDNTAFAIPTATLYVKGGATTGGTCDVVIRGGVAGQNNGKARLWLSADASHSSYIESQHTGSGNTQLTFGTANGNVLPDEKMRIGNNGNVSIGTTDTASYKLNVNGNSFFNGVMNFNTAYNGGGAEFACNKINVWGTGGNYGFGISGGTLDYFTGSTHRWWYGGGGTNFGTQGMVLTNGGLNVSSSIYTAGTIQSSGAFYFASSLWHKCNASNDRLYFAPNSTTYIKGGWINFRSSSDTDMAYFSNNLFYCYGPIGLSDRRIKRDIEEINDETALNMILQVQPTTYYYRDEARNKGNGKVYGFIAQQIKEVIPDAVHTTKEIIANIYKTCLIYNKREIYHSIPQDVAIDTEVHILNKEGGEKGKRYKIKEIYDDYFVIDEDIEGDECFVFGFMVDDLNALDKSYIFTLNVCATQELHRRMEAQDKRIKELETKLEKLINYIYQ
jgi:hypothetical protein